VSAARCAAHGITQTISEWTAPEAGARKATAAEVGTAVHQVMRFLDLAPLVRDPSLAELERQIDSLTAHGIIETGLRPALKPYLEPIRRFYASPLAQRLLAAEQAGMLYREMPFSMAVPAREISPDVDGVAGDDRMLIQGMIDLWFREDGRAVLIDFKTDRLCEPLAVRTEPLADRAETLRSRYRVQLDCYARAITLAAGLPVAERLIYSLQDGQFVPFAAAANAPAWGDGLLTAAGPEAADTPDR